MLKEAFGDGSGASTVSIGLYNTTDNLADGDNVESITTEPSGSGYSRQSVALGTDFTLSNVGGNWQAEANDVVFDTDDSIEDVNGYFVTVVFESDEAGDASPSENLVFSGDLDKQYDLDSVTTFTMQGSGISLD